MDFLAQHPFIRLTAHDKALGALIGSALGDALGIYTEFLPKTGCERVYPSPHAFTLLHPRTVFHQDNHRDKFSEGGWTDDTDQALTIMLSFLHTFEPGEKHEVAKWGDDRGKGRKDVVDEKDVAKRIRVWMQQGLRCLDTLPMGIGRTIGRVVSSDGYIDDPQGAALGFWLKSRREAAPNGSLMRTHPLGVMCVGHSLEETFDVATRVGRITHVDPRCVVSCCAVTALVRGLVRGEVLNERDMNAVLDQAFEWVDGKEELKNPKMNEGDDDWENVGKERQEAAEPKLTREEYMKYVRTESFRELQLDDSQKMGYVYKCLGAAVLCLRIMIRRTGSAESINSDEFEKIIVQLIMEGGDADTNACVAGALLGAWVGYSRLPPHWEKGISNREWLLKKARFVVDRSGMTAFASNELHHSEEADPDTAIDGGKGLLSAVEVDKREAAFVKMVLDKQKARRLTLDRKEKANKGGPLAKWLKY